MPICNDCGFKFKGRNINICEKCGSDNISVGDDEFDVEKYRQEMKKLSLKRQKFPMAVFIIAIFIIVMVIYSLLTW